MMWVFLYGILFLTDVAKSRVGEQERSVSENIKILNKIIKQKSWMILSVANQQVFIDGELRTFADIKRHFEAIDEGNVHVVTRAMYVALGCRCGETIVHIMRMLMGWLEESGSNVYETGPYLEELNRIVLKTSATLFDFIDLAPNVMTLEPGILKATRRRRDRIDQHWTRDLPNDEFDRTLHDHELFFYPQKARPIDMLESDCSDRIVSL